MGTCSSRRLQKCKHEAPIIPSYITLRNTTNHIQITTLLVVQNNIVKYTQQYFYGERKERKKNQEKNHEQLSADYLRQSLPSSSYDKPSRKLFTGWLFNPTWIWNWLVTCCCGSWTTQTQTHPPSTQRQHEASTFFTHMLLKTPRGLCTGARDVNSFWSFFQTQYASWTKKSSKGQILSRTHMTIPCRFEDTEEYKTGNQHS